MLSIFSFYTFHRASIKNVSFPIRYVKDRLSLLKHMNGIHLWHKAPQLVILNKYEHYCKTQLDEHMFQVTAFTTSTILDAISACAKKNNISKAYLLICAQLDSRLRFVMNMYFNYILNHEEDLLKKVYECFNIK